MMIIDGDAKKALIKKFAMKAGNMLDRIDKMGQLKLKKGQMKAKPPSLMMLKMELEKINGPYSDIIKEVGSNTGIGYGKQNE